MLIMSHTAEYVHSANDKSKIGMIVTGHPSS